MTDPKTNLTSNVFQRLHSELRLKLLLTLVLNLWFYLPYCWLQRRSLAVPIQMHPSYFDRLIPFSDRAVWIYLSLFLLMPVGPLLMSRRAQLLRYGSGVFLIATVSYLVFLLWPTCCPRPDSAHSTAPYRVLTTLDRPSNACPSLHAAFAVFSALCAAQVLRELPARAGWRVAVGFWTLLILLGTLLTKQHLLADIIAGSILGFVVYFVVFNEWVARLAPKVSPPINNSNKMQPSSTPL